MSNTQSILIRVPRDLKERLQEQARLQGVSLNQLIGYSLSREVSYLEARTYLERRLAGKTPEEIHQRFAQVMRKIEDRDVPEWDRMPEEP